MADRPNFLIILCDDLGHDDLSLHGNPFAETPNLDALGAESARFKEFTVNPVCAPSRATFLTGRHFLRTGVSHVHGGKDFLHLEEITIAEKLREAGYATGMWGKWHSGTGEGYDPWQRGFDEAYMAQLYQHENTHGLRHGGEPVRHEVWADRVIADYAIDFIDRHRAQPWFAFLPTMTPHGPHAAPPAVVQRFLDKGLDEPIAKIFAMIAFLDEQMGRVFEFLRTEGLYDDTVILFLSDNGPAREDHLTEEQRLTRKVLGLRGWKGDIWEMGVRSPLFARWGNRWQPRLVEQPAEMPDLFPTLCELAGVDLPEDHPQLDGQSLVNLLGENSGYEDTPIFNYAGPGWPPGLRPYSGEGLHDEYRPVPPEKKERLIPERQVISIREGRFKLLLNPNINWQAEGQLEDYQEWFLVDLENDPGETQNVAEKHPEVFERLRENLLDWFRTVRDEDPHSFTAPMHFAPTSPGESLMIPAKHTCRLGIDLKNTVQLLRNWSKAGQFADYHLQIPATANGQALPVRVELLWHTPPATPALFTVSFGEEAVDLEQDYETGEWIADDPLLLTPGVRGELRIDLPEIDDATAVPAHLQGIRLTVLASTDYSTAG